MSAMPIKQVRAEFARRKVRFYPDEEFEEIATFGLFTWRDIEPYIESGQVIPNEGYTKEHVTIWCKPSREEWEQHIKPLIERYPLRELTIMAGWRVD